MDFYYKYLYIFNLIFYIIFLNILFLLHTNWTLIAILDEILILIMPIIFKKKVINTIVLIYFYRIYINILMIITHLK